MHTRGSGSAPQPVAYCWPRLLPVFALLGQSPWLPADYLLEITDKVVLHEERAPKAKQKHTNTQD